MTEPNMEWKERFYAFGNECSFDWDGVPEKLESFIAKEIQSAVEEERRRIAEEIGEDGEKGDAIWSRK